MAEGAEDEARVKAMICVANNLGDPKEALRIMEMLGLIDGQGEFVRSEDMVSHLNNPHKRGIGAWNS
jgi:hypothetical protein